ncbi:MAG: nucleotide exchange factor GrpE [Nitrospirae bacterium]|nr:nucleotide exchange factor GrpE [Nitrospirota bacterium]
MAEDKEDKFPQEDGQEGTASTVRTEDSADAGRLKKELAELNDKYIRLYADFENYRRKVNKDKEELIKYSNEELIRELLSVIDHLELAVQHSSANNNVQALSEGVQMTLKELKNTLEKFGLVNIDAQGKRFDPFIHHAMSQVETAGGDENMVVTEFRKGYMLKDRVLRAALVSVSKRTSQDIKPTEIKEEE